MEQNFRDNALFVGDNLDVLRGMNSETVDLIATDPPFNTKRNRAGTAGQYADKWRWLDPNADRLPDQWMWNEVHPVWLEQIGDQEPALVQVIEATRKTHDDGIAAFLCFMAVRLLEMKRVLKPTGNIFLHCDHNANGYLRIPQARDLIRAARRGDQAAVDRTIALIIHQRGFDEALTDVFFPVLQTIGEIWHQGRISITGEQSVSRTIQRLLVHSHQHHHHPNHPYALIACVPNDFHEIGAMSAARLLRANGWNTTYLGPDVNVDVVRLACRRRHGKLVLLSCAVEPPSSDMKNLIDDIVRQLLPLTKVVMGGRGADVYRDWLERRGIRYIVEINRVKAITPRLLGRFNTAS